jgi:hypothetical protein
MRITMLCVLIATVSSVCGLVAICFSETTTRTEFATQQTHSDTPHAQPIILNTEIIDASEFLLRPGTRLALTIKVTNNSQSSVVVPTHLLSSNADFYGRRGDVVPIVELVHDVDFAEATPGDFGVLRPGQSVLLDYNDTGVQQMQDRGVMVDAKLWAWRLSPGVYSMQITHEGNPHEPLRDKDTRGNLQTFFPGSRCDVVIRTHPVVFSVE